MRLNLRLHGRTAAGQKCQADISVYASSQKELQEQADIAARSAAWLAADPPYNPIPEGSRIIVENVDELSSGRQVRVSKSNSKWMSYTQRG